MRRINKIFLTGCGYAVFILTLFYTFAAISEFVSPAIAPGQFALILCFGFIISFAEFMYEQLKLRKVYKCLIHYAVLMVAFCLIFIVSGNISAQRPSAIFISIVIYTLLYFVVWFTVHYVRKAINKADDKLDAKTKSSCTQKTKNTKVYKSLYRNEDTL